MIRWLKWLREHAYQAYWIALLFMVVPATLMFFAAQSGANGWIWALLGFVVFGNLLVLWIK